MRKDQRIEKNPAGFLYRSISDDYPLPADYVAGTAPKPMPSARKVIPFPQAPASHHSTATSDRAEIDAFWGALPPDEQRRIEEELVAQAPRFLREQYLEGREERGLLFQTVRQAIIDEYARKTMNAPR